MNTYQPIIKDNVIIAYQRGIVSGFIWGEGFENNALPIRIVLKKVYRFLLSVKNLVPESLLDEVKKYAEEKDLFELLEETLRRKKFLFTKQQLEILKTIHKEVKEMREDGCYEWIDVVVLESLLKENNEFLECAYQTSPLEISLIEAYLKKLEYKILKGAA